MKKIIAYGWLGGIVGAILVFFGYALYESHDLQIIVAVIICGVALGLFTNWTVSETLK